MFTSALGAGFRPKKPVNGAMDMPFTGVITLEDVRGGTKYTAIGIHPDAATAKSHADMGFHTGWGAALDQLVAVIKGTRG